MMPKCNEWEFQCRGKVTYGTWAQAYGEARFLRRRFSEVQHPYVCGHCGGIHLGHGEARAPKPVRVRWIGKYEVVSVGGQA